MGGVHDVHDRHFTGCLAHVIATPHGYRAIGSERDAVIVAAGDRSCVVESGGNRALAKRIVTPGPDCAIGQSGETVLFTSGDGCRRGDVRGDFGLMIGIAAPSGDGAVTFADEKVAGAGGDVGHIGESSRHHRARAPNDDCATRDQSQTLRAACGDGGDVGKCCRDGGLTVLIVAPCNDRLDRRSDDVGDGNLCPPSASARGVGTEFVDRAEDGVGCRDDSGGGYKSGELFASHRGVGNEGGTLRPCHLTRECAAEVCHTGGCRGIAIEIA